MTENRWMVVVGNVGTVYDGPVEDEARKTYNDYVEFSIYGEGRASNENVTLFSGNEIVSEFFPE
jgi:hypothetical protein